MIDFSNKTYANLLKELKDNIVLNVNKRDTSLVLNAIMPIARELSNLYQQLNQIQEDNFILTASGTNLDKIVLIKGITRKAPTPAKRKLITNIAIDEGQQFGTISVSEDNIVFTSLDDTTLNTETNNYETTVVCDYNGTIGNEYFGDVLPLINISGLTTCELSDVIEEGTNEESDNSVRTRFLDSLASQSFAGNITAYRAKVLSIDNVGAVQVYPHYDGGGTVLLSILNANYESASNALVETVQNIICPPEENDNTPSPLGYGFAPIGAKVDVVTGTNKILNISFTVTLEQGTGSIESETRTILNNYFKEVIEEKWGAALTSNLVQYPVTIYIQRMINALLNGISSIIDIRNMQINGSSDNYNCIENSSTQEIPIVGTITITEA